MEPRRPLDRSRGLRGPLQQVDNLHRFQQRGIQPTGVVHLAAFIAVRYKAYTRGTLEWFGLQRSSDAAQLKGLDRGGVTIEHHQIVFLTSKVRDPYPGNRTTDLTGLYDVAVLVTDVEQGILGPWFIVEHEQALKLIDPQAYVQFVLVHGVGGCPLVRRTPTRVTTKPKGPIHIAADRAPPPNQKTKYHLTTARMG